MFSYKDFDQCFDQSFHQTQDIASDEYNEAKEAKTEIKALETESKTNEKIRNLCRICSSNGLISIQATLKGCNLKFKPSGDQSLWQIPISQLIAEISGEEVKKDRVDISDYKTDLYSISFRFCQKMHCLSLSANTALDIYNMPINSD